MRKEDEKDGFSFFLPSVVRQSKTSRPNDCSLSPYISERAILDCSIGYHADRTAERSTGLSRSRVSRGLFTCVSEQLNRSPPFLYVVDWS